MISKVKKKLKDYCDKNRVLNPCVVSFIEEVMNEMPSYIGQILVDPKNLSHKYILLERPNHNGYAHVYDMSLNITNLKLIDPPEDHNRDPELIPE